MGKTALRLIKNDLKQIEMTLEMAEFPFLYGI